MHTAETPPTTPSPEFAPTTHGRWAATEQGRWTPNEKEPWTSNASSRRAPLEDDPERLPDWVPESRFGKWFLATDIWDRYVVHPAICTLVEFARAAALPPVGRLLDIGCGRGTALRYLRSYFAPDQLLGIDIDPEMVARARAIAPAIAAPSMIDVRHGSVNALPLADDSIDLVFCHQLIHHVADQQRAVAELYRVLAPGGALLLAESCVSFIRSWPVRWFFRHPHTVQRTGPEYLALLADQGFQLEPAWQRLDAPWWSQPDFGVGSALGISTPRRDATELLVLARKPGPPQSPRHSAIYSRHPTGDAK